MTDRREFIKGVAAVAVLPLIPIVAIESVPVVSAGKLTGFTTAELSLSIDELSKLYIEPAMKALVRGIEQDMLGVV